MSFFSPNSPFTSPTLHSSFYFALSSQLSTAQVNMFKPETSSSNSVDIVFVSHAGLFMSKTVFCHSVWDCSLHIVFVYFILNTRIACISLFLSVYRSGNALFDLLKYQRAHCKPNQQMRISLKSLANKSLFIQAEQLNYDEYIRLLLLIHSPFRYLKSSLLPKDWFNWIILIHLSYFFQSADRRAQYLSNYLCMDDLSPLTDSLVTASVKKKNLKKIPQTI